MLGSSLLWASGPHSLRAERVPMGGGLRGAAGSSSNSAHQPSLEPANSSLQGVLFSVRRTVQPQKYQWLLL